jgi:hypothetical protein
MELSGSIAHNLRYAIESAKRLRGKSVHADTMQYWRELIGYAREKHPNENGVEWMIEDLAVKLEAQISSRIK